jgi:hypothetical protein
VVAWPAKLEGWDEAQKVEDLEVEIPDGSLEGLYPEKVDGSLGLLYLEETDDLDGVLKDPVLE